MRRGVPLPSFGQRMRAAANTMLPRRLRRALHELVGASPGALYQGARFSRIEQDWVHAIIAADEELKRDWRLLRARSREMAKNSPYAKHFLRVLPANVIGPYGFRHEPQIVDRGGQPSRLNGRVSDRFQAWSRRCSLDGRMSLNSLQRLQLKTVATEGEAITRKWRGPDFRDGLALEAIDPDMLDMTYNIPPGYNNEVRMGVEVDELSRRMAYHIWDGPPSYARIRTRRRIPANEIIHTFDTDRVQATRGVTWFHAVMLYEHLARGGIESELTASRASADKHIIWQRRKDADPIAGSEEKSARITVEESQPGSEVFAPDDYEAAEWDPQHPNTSWTAFMKLMSLMFATGIGISYETLTSDLSGATYSSMKAGRQNERDLWQVLQEWWIEQFLCPVYEEWMPQSVLMGYASGGSLGLTLDTRPIEQLLAVNFEGRGWESPDPARDAGAAKTLIGLGLKSRTQYHAEGGTSWKKTIAQLGEEGRDAEAEKVDISGATTAPAQPAADEPTNTDEPTPGKNGNGNGNNRVAAYARD